MKKKNIKSNTAIVIPFKKESEIVSEKCKEFYDAFLQKGFTSEQAFDLVRCLIEDGTI
jgi:hypothetical protein